jgi:hypothetical protein
MSRALSVVAYAVLVTAVRIALLTLVIAALAVRLSLAATVRPLLALRPGASPPYARPGAIGAAASRNAPNLQPS